MPACSAVGCTNRTGRDRKKGITFHKFPKDESLRKKWTSALRRKDDYVPSKIAVLCSHHFKEEVIDRTSLVCVRLREGAVPSIFPPYRQQKYKYKKIKPPPTRTRILNEPVPATETTADVKTEENLQISPAFLHANSTSHTWAFSAFAELIDNAYDPDVSASELLIDKIDINGIPCLIFLDNGAGMDSDHLLKMLSFGYCEKQVYERTSSHMPIGHYGNGFKSGSMRMAKDALVFTRCHNSASIGFLSQTYLKAIGADSVVVPILTYRLPKLERIKSQESRNNLDAILKYSVFHSEQDLKEELLTLEGSMTGTKIILSNLKRLQDGRLELDFSSDETDIRCPESHEVDLTSVYHRPIQQSSSEYKHSLKEYCSILFLRPRMKITIRGQRVKSKLISKSLFQTEHDSYKPTWMSRPLKITFGFTCEKAKSEDYGMMLYHRNRLIKPFEKVGYQKQPNDLGLGVVGVAQVDFLQPTHNKQDFNKDEKFNSVMAAFATKLNDYWNEKKHNTSGPVPSLARTSPDWLWAQCEQCLKWRRLPDGVRKEELPDQWFCRLNPDPTHNRCEIPEEPEDEDLAIKPTYEKTFKKKQEERKRQQHYERQREEEMKRQRLMEREKELKQKEAELMAIRQARNMNGPPPHHPPGQPGNNQGTLTKLQRALAESRRREEEQKRMLLKIQEEKKMMDERKKSILQLAESLKTGRVENGEDVIKKMSSLLGVQRMEANFQSPQKRKQLQQEDPNRNPKRPFIKEEIIDPPPSNSARPAANVPRQTPQPSAGSLIQKAAISTNHMPDMKLPTGGANQAPGAATPQTPPRQKNPAESSDVRPQGRRSNRANGAEADVIDLTLEADNDVKPNMEELKARKQAVQGGGEEDEDIKPDKDALDANMQDKMASEEKTVSNGAPAEKEKNNQVPAEGENRSPSQAVTNGATDDLPKFGPSEDDPEFKMGSTDAFHSNLEAAMAVIMEKMNEEKEMDGAVQRQAQEVDKGDQGKGRRSVSEVINDTAEKVFKERKSVGEKDKGSDSQTPSPIQDRSRSVEEDTPSASSDDNDDGDFDNFSDGGNDSEGHSRISALNFEKMDKDQHDSQTLEKQVTQIIDDLIAKVVEIAESGENSSCEEDYEDDYNSNFEEGSSRCESPGRSHLRDEPETTDAAFLKRRSTARPEAGVDDDQVENSSSTSQASCSDEIDTEVGSESRSSTRENCLVELDPKDCESVQREESESMSSENSVKSAPPKRAASLENPKPPMTSAAFASVASPKPLPHASCDQSTQTDTTLPPQSDEMPQTCPNCVQKKCVFNKDSQTDHRVKEDHDPEKIAMQEIIDKLRSKQEVKSQLLEMAEQRVNSLCENVHRLLTFILPEVSLGTVADTEQMIKNMIKSHEDSLTNSMEGGTEGEDSQTQEM